MDIFDALGYERKSSVGFERRKECEMFGDVWKLMGKLIWRERPGDETSWSG